MLKHDTRPTKERPATPITVVGRVLVKSFLDSVIDGMGITVPTTRVSLSSN